MILDKAGKHDIPNLMTLSPMVQPVKEAKVLRELDILNHISNS